MSPGEPSLLVCGGSWSTCASAFARDAWQELKGQPFRDDPFSELDWSRHTTWRRYIPEPNVSGIVMISLAPVWMWSVVVSAAVGLYATYAEPKGWPNVSGHASLITVFTLTSFALSLLMLFKTTTSYGRWWEARTLLGSLYITVRSVLRLCISFVGRQHPELVPALYRWTAAIMPTLSAHLRGRSHYLEHLEEVMHPEELQWLRDRRFGKGIAPVAALQVLSRLLDRAGLEPMERQQIEHLLNQCDIVIGGCERIRVQPIPYAWNRHTHRFILAYITFLPFAFWSLYGWATLPIMAMLSFLLAGVENIGVQIEEPFRVLPLNHICAGTSRALKFMLDDRQASADMAGFAAGLQGTRFPAELAVDLPPPADQRMAAKAAGADAGRVPPAAFGSSESWRRNYSSGKEGQGQQLLAGDGMGSLPSQVRVSGSNGLAPPPAAPSVAEVEATPPSSSTLNIGTPTIRDSSGDGAGM